MGYADDVILEGGYSEHGIAPETVLRSKSLYGNGSVFTITYDGRLIEHLSGPAGRESPASERAAQSGTMVIDYHGDLLLDYVSADHRHHSFVARFTHGQLEWLRPVDEYPEANRMLLVKQWAP